MKTTLDNSKSGNPNRMSILKEVHVIVTFNDGSIADNVFSTEEYQDPQRQARKYATMAINDFQDVVEVSYKKVYAARGETVKLKVVRSGDANA